MKKEPCVYILANNKNGTLYVGVTSNLVQRVYQHRESQVEGFTKRYGIHQLVWYELHETMESAILKEKRLKTWERAAKIRLIESTNPNWQDLWSSLVVTSV
ncbi:GIY-YIG nuclease family protein [Methylotuvimicrobium sp. KM1]|uniref:GIY-YIG nuclease family protein n=1 Tax=Methylotuvimicrobium sp. KM1 TaxID=3377707 RepID=UPI00384B6FA3